MPLSCLREESFCYNSFFILSHKGCGISQQENAKKKVFLEIQQTCKSPKSNERDGRITNQTYYPISCSHISCGVVFAITYSYFSSNYILYGQQSYLQLFIKLFVDIGFIYFISHCFSFVFCMVFLLSIVVSYNLSHSERKSYPLKYHCPFYQTKKKYVGNKSIRKHSHI